MDTKQMKNIIVLKDLPSNIVDEAIIILKSNMRVKERKIAESEAEKDDTSCNDIAIKEAEFVVKNYIDKLEKPDKKTQETINLNIKYRNLKIFTFLLVITVIIGTIINLL